MGVAAAFGRVRTFVVETVVPAVGHSVAALRELVSSPLKMTLLFVGALLLQVGYIAALYFSVRALGGDVGFTTIGLIYLTVGSMASVAPTPGGVGAVEAVLLAALAGVGVVAGNRPGRGLPLPPCDVLAPDPVGCAGHALVGRTRPTLTGCGRGRPVRAAELGPRR